MSVHSDQSTQLDADAELQNPPLMDVARALVALTDLRPEKGEQFIADWLSECSEPVDEDPQAYRYLMTRLLSRWPDYLTTEQQARFVLANLPSIVAAQHFQRCLSRLIEQCTDESTAEELRKAGEAADVLTDWPLRAILGELAGPVSDPWIE